MKKLLVILGIIFLTTIVSVQQIRAEAKYHNFIDFTKMTVMKGNYEYMNSMLPIELEDGKTYTIVADYEFIGLKYRDERVLKGQVELSYEDFTKTKHSLNFEEDYAYMTFTMRGRRVFLNYFPIDKMQDNFKIILYQGKIEDFKGYMHYKKQLIHVVEYEDAPKILNVETLLEETHQYEMIASDYEQKVGTFYVLLRNKTTSFMESVQIKVIDTVAPHFIGEDEYELSYDLDDPIKRWIQTLNITDNYDQREQIKVTYELETDKIEMNQPYSLWLHLEDQSQNQAKYQIKVTFRDLNGPSISGPTIIYRYTTDLPLTNEQILSRFSAYDEQDQDSPEVYIISNEYEQTVTPGSYEMIVGSVDTNQNETKVSLQIMVIDNSDPALIIEHKTLTVAQMNQMTERDIIEWFLEEALKAKKTISNVVIISNEYELKRNDPGSYKIYISYEEKEQVKTGYISVEITQSRTSKALFWYITIPTIGVATLAVVYFKRRK